MIRVNDLDYSYSQQDHALKGISFEVKDQEWLSILGHNGSGKSTISKLLVGILAPQKGSIYYDDIELTEKTVDKIRNRVGIVFQNPDNQFVGVNVKYDIAFGRVFDSWSSGILLIYSFLYTMYIRTFFIMSIFSFFSLLTVVNRC